MLSSYAAFLLGLGCFCSSQALWLLQVLEEEPFLLTRDLQTPWAGGQVGDRPVTEVGSRGRQPRRGVPAGVPCSRDPGYPQALHPFLVSIPLGRSCSPLMSWSWPAGESREAGEASVIQTEQGDDKSSTRLSQEEEQGSPLALHLGFLTFYSGDHRW